MLAKLLDMTMKTTALLLLLILLCQTVVSQQAPQTNSNQPAATKPSDDPRLQEFENFVRAQMQQDRIPGLTIGFLKDDQTWVKAFGYSDVENKTPASENSAYRLASTTKTMTGVAIVQLAERGKINLDAEIQT